jgi:hypothetical protein
MAEDPIIIRGGSVDIEFDDTIFSKSDAKHSNGNKKITRVEITGDISFSPTPQNGTHKGTSTSGRCTVTIYCDDKP